MAAVPSPASITQLQEEPAEGLQERAWTGGPSGGWRPSPRALEVPTGVRDPQLAAHCTAAGIWEPSSGGPSPPPENDSNHKLWGPALGRRLPGQRFRAQGMKLEAQTSGDVPCSFWDRAAPPHLP